MIPGTAGVVLLSDPEVDAIGWGEDGDRLVDGATIADLRFDRRLADPRGLFTYLRQGLIDRLLLAQAALPDGLAFLLVEGYRPPELQEIYFTAYLARLTEAHPEWDPERCRRETSAYVAPPGVAPHCTGGAVDLTLCTTSGVELDLGTVVNASPLDSDGACYFDAPAVRGEPRRRREIMAEALTGAGLVNYPTEWWHWSYGERYWALKGGKPTTRYAPLPAPDPGLSPLAGW